MSQPCDTHNLTMLRGARTVSRGSGVDCVSAAARRARDDRGSVGFDSSQVTRVAYHVSWQRWLNAA